MDKETGTEAFHRLQELYKLQPVGRKSPGIERFLIDLSELRLRFSANTPLIWVRQELASTSPAPALVEELQDIAREQGWKNRDCIVLLDGEGVEVKKRTAGLYEPSFIVVDAAEQKSLLAARSLTTAFLDLIHKRMPISKLSPYQISAPVEGSGFFGREREIAKILSRPETNFAITGVRRIGKTSLMREIKRRLLQQGEEQKRIVWMDCSTVTSRAAFSEQIVSQLHYRELEHRKRRRYMFTLSDFLKRMSKLHGGRITIFLDEADKLLELTRSEGDILRTLRASANSGDARFIATGFQALMNEQDDDDSPFYKAFQPLRLTSLRLEETRKIVLEPMMSLRVRLEDEDELVLRIYGDTGGHPLLVQYYCMELLEQAEFQEEPVITLSHLDKIYGSYEFKTQIVNAFRDNVGIRDKLLVYCLLFPPSEAKAGFTQEEMYGALKRQGCHYSDEEIDRACDRLILAGVFVKETHHRFRFALPIFPTILRANYKLDHLISVAKKELV